MRVLVCGGRDYDDQFSVNGALNGIWDDFGPITTIIEGGANGADRCARRWAIKHHVRWETFDADWSLGKKAGPIRNQRMIDEGKPDLVAAFPGGRGTAELVRRAKAAGIEVRQIA